MSIKVEVLEPQDNEQVKVLITWSLDHELHPSVHVDEIEAGAPRHVIAFFNKADGSATDFETKTIETDIIHRENGTIGHSITAIAVLDNAVVAKDRKYVRGGVSERQ